MSGGRDLRLLIIAAVVWLTAVLAGSGEVRWTPVVALVAIALGRVVARLRWVEVVLPVLVVVTGCLAVVHLRSTAGTTGPVDELAQDRAAVSGVFVVSADPALRRGRFGDYRSFNATVTAVRGRGQAWRTRQRVFVIAPANWQIRGGATVAFAGRLAPPVGRNVAGMLTVRGPPRVIRDQGAIAAAGSRVRESIRAAVAGHGEASGLVPALVDGDDGGLSEARRAQFRLTGLTHLLAVSGTNLTLVVGSLLVLARRFGVRTWGLAVVGGLGVAGFVVLARAEPSVIRAAAMGVVGLMGLGAAGTQRALRALAVAVLVLVLIDPPLALDWGFALSATATAGLVLFAARWRDRLRGWLPTWVPTIAIEAVTVPLAAQLACTPLVAAISGQVSVVAVAANLAAAPAVAPATVLGLAAGLVGLVWPALGRVIAIPAAWAGDWILGVADRAARVNTPAFAWPTDVAHLMVLSVVCVVAVGALGIVFARPGPTLVCCSLVLGGALVPVPTPGYPPRGWVLAACDVGQGDGLLLNAGRGSAVVVDTGPDPALMAACLRRFGITRVPLVVLTHFHADHIGGLSAVLARAKVGAIEVTALADPQLGSRQVRAEAAQHQVPVRVATLGERGRVGAVSWVTLAPSGPVPAGSDSPPNDASVVMYVVVHGVRILMTGDEETDTQERLAALFPDLKVDVLKVAHHGSAKQDPALIVSLDARIAVISCGLGNDYGHPAPSTLAILKRADLLIGRTDRQGDVVVARQGDRLRLVTHLGVGHPTGP